MTSKMLSVKEAKIYMDPHYEIWGVVSPNKMLNGCCSDKPMVITTNSRVDGTTNYSCQCSCGGWCTNGHTTPGGALNEYLVMSRK